MPATSGSRREGRRRGGAAQLAQGRGVIPALLAGRLAAGLHRRLRRQRGHLRDAGRRAACPSGASPITARRTGCWVVSGRQEHPLRDLDDQPEEPRSTSFTACRPEGGLPEKLPVPYGEFGAISPDGKTLAYVPISVDFRTWKRYRGGMNPDIWLFDLQKLARPQPHRLARRRLRHRCGTATRSISCPTAAQTSAQQHLGVRPQADKFRQVTLLQGVRRAIPAHRPERHGVRERRPALPARPGRRRRTARWRSRSSRTAPPSGPSGRKSRTWSSGGTLSPAGRRAVFEARGDHLLRSRRARGGL